MKPESLHALLIDRELGELSPEAVELLEAWMAEHPESAAAISSIRRTLETASAAVCRFPELGRPGTVQPESDIAVTPEAGRADRQARPTTVGGAARPRGSENSPAGQRFRLASLAWAASVLILFGGTVWFGFRAGWKSAQKEMAGSRREPAPSHPTNAVKLDGPWARYTLASSPRGGLTVARRDANPQPQSLP